MQIELWKNFVKKNNSTLSPNIEGLKREVSLKRDTSLNNPTFLVSGVDFTFNYCKFNNRFYFIRDIVVGNNNVFELQCETDFLATYKSDIGSYNAFVERSSHTFNSMIPDSLLSQQQRLVDKKTKEIEIFPNADPGFYLLRVLGYSGGSQGVLSYLLNKSQLNQLQDFLFTEGNFEEIFSSGTFYKAVFNPGEYIIDIKWIPYAGAGTVEPIRFGWWESNISAIKINSLVYADSKTIDPFDSFYGDYRDIHPAFTMYEVFLPGVGLITLNPQDIGTGSDKIIVSYRVDVLTATIAYRLFTEGFGALITYCNGNLGVNIPLAQLNFNVGGVFNGLTSATSGATNGAGVGALAGPAGAVVGGIAGAVGGIIETVQAVTQPSQKLFSTSLGNMAELQEYNKIAFYRKTVGSATFPKDVLGRPLFAFKVLNTIPGYIKCSGASLNIKGLAGDRQTVNAFLNGGFYYE